MLALARHSSRRLPAWRLELLFMTALGVPYVLGVWLIPYLTDEAGFSAGLAGIFGVVLYATSAVFRPEGSRLEAEGTSLSLLGGVAPLIAAAGLVLLAVSDAKLAVIGEWRLPGSASRSPTPPCTTRPSASSRALASRPSACSASAPTSCPWS